LVRWNKKEIARFERGLSDGSMFKQGDFSSSLFITVIHPVKTLLPLLRSSSYHHRDGKKSTKSLPPNNPSSIHTLMLGGDVFVQDQVAKFVQDS
jgi:hypothetical protein